ncbi:MAG TPA: zf-HC2 domain-containing protein [Thermoanaerobaculia bacterium]|nr:zf-HC2 domain-containing protein [Thermoanaerobaculia bacterium]
MSSSDFRDILLELVDTSPETMDHPSPDAWIAYHRGELPTAEEERLQEHLMRCRDCFDLAGAAASFAQSHEEPGAGQEVETAALWRLLRPQLDPSEPSRQNVREISDHPRRRSWGGRLPMALAASFFVALVALSAWSLHQRSALEMLRAPKPNVLIAEFSADERLATLASAEKTLTAPTGPWILVFHPANELPAYRLALREVVTGRELWSYELRPGPDFALKIQLPEGLRPGRYRLELSDGSGGGAGKVLETHLLRVTEPGGGD